MNNLKMEHRSLYTRQNFLSAASLDCKLDGYSDLEMFYLNTIEQWFLFVEQLEVYLPYSRLIT